MQINITDQHLTLKFTARKYLPNNMNTEWRKQNA